MKLIAENNCTGCMACFSICPVQAINIKQSKNGFYVPIIDEKKCIDCKLCQKTCPQLNTTLKFKSRNDVLACWIKDYSIRKESTSGGISSALAEYVIKNQGVVFGAMFDENYKVVHYYVDKLEDLHKLRGSKYVQSYVGNSLKKVKEFLEKDVLVLFTGTSCQIAGLKKFLNKDYDNLLTVDVLCHGAPSPIIFNDYLKSKQQNGKIKDIQFRYKKPSWSVFSMNIKYEDGSVYQKNTFEDEFIRAFLYDYITNPACSNCKYTGIERISDITIADFWGYISETKKFRNTEEGISLVILNSKKGEKLFDNIKSNIIYTKKNINEAVEGNQCLREPFKKNDKYNQFWDDYLEKGYTYVRNKYFVPTKESTKRKLSSLFNDNAYIFPRKLRNMIMDIRKKIK